MFLVLFGFFLWQTGGLGAFLKWFQGGRPQVADSQTTASNSSGASSPTASNAAPAVNAAPAAPSSAAPAPTDPAASSTGSSTAPENAKPETTPPAKEEPKPEAPEAKKTEEKPQAEPAPAPHAGAPKVQAKATPPPIKAHPKPAPPPPAAAANPQTECDRRMAFLRAGDARGEAGATAQLGTMYMEGRCVGRDLPTAYRFYARALHKDPNNAQIADTIAAIWKQMSPAERQLAIKPQQ
jgi:TPR repeat protein